MVVSIVRYSTTRTRNRQLCFSLERIGLDKARNYQVKELWSGNETSATGQLEVTVPSKDVQLLEFK